MMEVVDGPVEDNMEWLYVVASISTYATQAVLVLLGGAMVVMGEIEQIKKGGALTVVGAVNLSIGSLLAALTASSGWL